VRYRVGLQPAGFGEVPVVGADRDVVLEQAAGLRSAATAMFALRFARGQRPGGLPLRKAGSPPQPVRALSSLMACLRL